MLRLGKPWICSSTQLGLSVANSEHTGGTKVLNRWVELVAVKAPVEAAVIPAIPKAIPVPMATCVVAVVAATVIPAAAAAPVATVALAATPEAAPAPAAVELAAA